MKALQMTQSFLQLWDPILYMLKQEKFKMAGTTCAHEKINLEKKSLTSWF